jgi:excinuclease ABC subunit C
MREKFFKGLFEKRGKLKILKDKLGRIVFVGNVRQIRRRIKLILKSTIIIPPLKPATPPSETASNRTATDATLLYQVYQAERLGFVIDAAKKDSSKEAGKLYNRAMDKLKEKLKDIPKEPGVYQFLNKDGEVIYVGKAKSLKSRVGQYFTGHDNRPQLPYLMAEATDVQYTVVANELESLFLENTLIKKYLPKYNIQLRDDKNYAFITIDYTYQIPQIGYSRKFVVDPQSKISNLKSQIRYFGPYSAAWKIRNTLNLVRRIFPYCANTEVGSRPCFYYYLHRCPGVCIGKISLEEYNLQLDRICWFLSGNTSKITQELKNEMKIAASSQQFEKAARLRDQLQALELLQERQNVIMPKPVAWDVISVTENAGYACINLFKIREGKMLDKENFVFEVTTSNLEIPSNSTNDYKSETLQTFLEQYYLEASDIPKTIYTQIPAQDTELIEHIIRSRVDRKSEITTPQKGKPLELIKLGVTNAEEYLKNWLSNQAGHLDKINTALEELKTQLHLEKIPTRIECYDISNIQGTNPVGSMVVFKQGLPAKSEYRKFKIQGKRTPDDFAMMREMLSRRLARIPLGGKSQDTPPKADPPLAENSKTQTTTKPKIQSTKTAWPMPDLIVIDGGKGQLGVAMEILKEKNLTIPIVGLAKRIEEIFFPENPEALVLPHDNPGLQLLQRLRDETHRFGITFHRELRSKQAVKSALDDIPGIGPKTKKILKEKFGTVAQIRTTPFDKLAQVVGERIAQLIQQSL